MVGLSDSVTVGILLLLIFGAAAFYLYSRMTQNEKRLSLLENLLLTLKISTEASLSGPDLVEAVSNPAPLESHDVDQVNEEEYADMLKEVAPPARQADAEADAEEMLRSMEVPVPAQKTEVSVNYESMTVKELQGLAKERGLPSMTRKKELVEALKRGGPPPASPMPLATHSVDEFAGVEADTVEGFAVSLDE